MTKDKSTPENRAYWDFVEKTAAEVRTWPAWMKGERMPDVRKMGTYELINRLLDHEQKRAIKGDLDVTKGHPFRDELARRLGIMEELCEAEVLLERTTERYHEGHANGEDVRVLRERRDRARYAYRAMKGEQNA